MTAAAMHTLGVALYVGYASCMNVCGCLGRGVREVRVCLYGTGTLVGCEYTGLVGSAAPLAIETCYAEAERTALWEAGDMLEAGRLN
eukprot:jgi/Botrbrau1/4086/Bobra.152_3s0037.1